ncbi:hypothetical protein OWC48_44695 [Bradyrhizobium sp. Arg816]|nr:hypothetical protein [Bradyrhizobium sp. Arg816]
MFTEEARQGQLQREIEDAILHGKGGGEVRRATETGSASCAVVRPRHLSLAALLSAKLARHNLR